MKSVSYLVAPQSLQLPNMKCHCHRYPDFLLLKFGFHSDDVFTTSLVPSQIIHVYYERDRSDPCMACHFVLIVNHSLIHL